jgi:hypothetical protein
VTGAVLIKVPHFRPLWLLVLKGGVASRADTLRLRRTSPADHFDVPYGSIGAEMTCDREIIDNANGGRVFHFLR